MDEMRYHKKLYRIDLTDNLVPFKFVHIINARCHLNNWKTDDKLIPRLQKELKKEKHHNHGDHDYDQQM